MRTRVKAAAIVVAVLALSGCGVTTVGQAAPDVNESTTTTPHQSVTPEDSDVPTDTAPPTTGTSAPEGTSQSGQVDPTTAATTTTVTSAVGPPVRSDPDHIIGYTEHTTGKHVALTFDDGPDPTWTPQVLALLSQYHVRATFCLIGNNAKAYPELVRQIVAAGHVLCDHTMTHDEQLPKRSQQVIQREIAGARQAILDAAPNASVMYYRAPAGNFSRRGAPVSVQKIAVALGMRPLAWSLDTRDWTRPGAQAIINSVEQHLGDHDVVLMHDAGGDRSQTIAALRTLLPWLGTRGYEFDIPA